MHLHSSRRSFLAAAAAFAASSGTLASHGRQKPAFLHGVARLQPAASASTARLEIEPAA